MCTTEGSSNKTVPPGRSPKRPGDEPEEGGCPRVRVPREGNGGPGGASSYATHRLLDRGLRRPEGSAKAASAPPVPLNMPRMQGLTPSGLGSFLTVFC